VGGVAEEIFVIVNVVVVVGLWDDEGS